MKKQSEKEKGRQSSATGRTFVLTQYRLGSLSFCLASKRLRRGRKPTNQPNPKKRGESVTDSGGHSEGAPGRAQRTVRLLYVHQYYVTPP